MKQFLTRLFLCSIFGWHRWWPMAVHLKTYYSQGQSETTGDLPYKRATRILKQCLVCMEHRVDEVDGNWTIEQVRSANESAYLEKLSHL